MNIFTTFKLALRALWRNKVRSSLTMLGIIFGIGTVIAMIASGQGARESVAEVFRAMGTNLLIVQNSSSRMGGVAGGAGSSFSLTWDDYNALENGEVPTVRWAAPVLQFRTQISSEDTNWNTTVTGTKPSFFKIKNWAPKEGTLFDDDAAATGPKIAVIGQTVVKQLYSGTNPIGQAIRINGHPFEVVGVLEAKGQSAMGQDQDDTVVVPLKAYVSTLDRGVGKYITRGQIYLSTHTEADIPRAETQVTALLRQRHSLGAADEDDFRVRNLAEFALRQKQSTDKITTLLAIVAAMSLVVGGIGVMNIMLVSVIERARDRDPHGRRREADRRHDPVPRRGARALGDRRRARPRVRRVPGQPDGRLLRLEVLLPGGDRGNRVRGRRRRRCGVRALPGGPSLAARSDHGLEVRDMTLRGTIIAAILAASPSALAQPQALTIEQAVEIAQRQQPALRQSRAAVEAARGRVDQVQATRRPTVTLSASGTVSGSGSSSSGTSTMMMRDFLDPTGGASVGASASWRIWDFGLTGAQLRAAQADAKATAAAVETTVLDVRVGVETSYLEAVARGRLVAVAEATVKSEEAHLDQARRFVAAQAKDPIEVVQAQSRAANARAALAQARSASAIALANLRSSIGWVDPVQTLAVPSGWPTPPADAPPALPVLVQTARGKRPELAQLDLEIAAADANLDAARAGRRPVLSASANTQWSPGTNDWSPQPSWSVGLSLSWLVFDGGRTAANVRVARANRESALAQRDAVLLALTAELDATRAQIEANRAATEASTEAVQSARAQLKLAEARYAQGLGSQIEIADAQTAVTTAEGNLISSEFQLATAWASLRRALGT
jgi:putative ABC transport system permease protein